MSLPTAAIEPKAGAVVIFFAVVAFFAIDDESFPPEVIATGFFAIEGEVAPPTVAVGGAETFVDAAAFFAAMIAAVACAAVVKVESACLPMLVGAVLGRDAPE